MAYRLTYTANISWVGAGLNAMTLPNAQTLKLSEKTGTSPSGQNAFGAGAGGTINGADVTVLTNAMAADIAAQMNLAANLAIINGWVTGNG
jgi:hypothetical protein